MSALMLCGLLVLCACGEGSSNDNPSDGDAEAEAPDGDGETMPESDEESETEIADTDGDQDGLARLHTEGRDIVDANGDMVRLRGFNLGGWLFNETWITGIDYEAHSRVYMLAKEKNMEEDIRAVLLEVGPQRIAGILPTMSRDEWLAAFETSLTSKIGDEEAAQFMADLEACCMPMIYDDSDRPLMQLLENRFGIEERDSLIDTFMANWVTEKDIEWIASEGFNVVRVPMGYCALTTGSHLPNKPDELVWNELAFARIDELLDWCDKHGVYAILDIQETPGGQNDYSGQGAELYSDPHMKELAVDLWTYLSDRYIDRNAVAAYSLLAEPYGAPSIEARDEVYDLLVKAVRENGDDHMLIIHDGFKGMGSLPNPVDMGWDNVVYSTHQFEWDARDVDYYEFIIEYSNIPKAQAEQNVPYYIGSMSTIFDEPWAYESADLLISWYEENGWSWSVWTFKRIDDPVVVELWEETTAWGGLGRLYSSFDVPDIHRDDIETIRAKFEAYSDMDIRPNEELVEVLTKPMNSQ